MGSWFRMYAILDDSFWPILMGYAWLSISYPISLSAATIIANKWYNDKERALVTSMCGLAIPLGSIVSFVMAGLIFTSDIAKVRQEMYNLLWYQNVWITLITVPFVFIIKDKPVNPPSLVSTQEPAERNFCIGIGDVMKNKSYVLLLVIFGFIDGSFISFSDIISMIFSKYFTDGEIAMFGTLTVIFGVLSSMCVGIML